MEVSVAAVTVTLAVPDIEPTVAVTVTLPIAIGNTTPLAFTVTRAGFELDQATVAVKFCVLPSLKTPVAVSPDVKPKAKLNDDGVTVIEVRIAGLTVTLADPDTPFSVAEIVVLPAAKPVNCPAVPKVLLTVARTGFATLHWTDVVTFCVLPSVKAAVALKLCDCPIARVTDAGVIEIDTTCAGVTLMLKVADTAPLVPVIVASPAASALTRPLALTFATLGADDVQFSVEVTFCVLPSLNVAVAVSCWLVPAARLNVNGLMLMPSSVAAVTWTGCVVWTEPDVTVTLALPVATPSKSPAVLTLATAVFELAKDAVEVMFWVVPSLKTPVAVICNVCPNATERVDGESVIETRLAEVTFRVAFPETLDDEAVIVQAPALTAVAKPLLLMVHIALGEVVQETELVRFCVLPSDMVALAVNCAVVPFAALVANGVTLIVVIVALLTVTDAVAEKSW
jgi:hypothetical protein